MAEVDVAVEAVVFDWGGTLAEFVPLEMTDVWTLAARHLAPEREREVAERLCAVEARFWDRTAGACRSATLADLVAEASAELGLDVAEAVLEEAALGHLDAWTPHIRHFATAASALETLRRRGLRLGLLSNTHWPRAFHERFLARDGLAEFLDVRLYTSEMTHLKPHPSVFEAVLEALEVDDPATIVFVGDRPYDDIWGARRAGMRTVWVANDHAAPWDVVADAVVTDLADLPPVVDAWR
ncbi:MAG TPA: HAD family hydrolase [Acidimicrobiales bacterium]|nr:HAD family hydrolase [Acidimicrobiales bacterium]